jgi:hypothetical protein
MSKFRNVDKHVKNLSSVYLLYYWDESKVYHPGKDSGKDLGKAQVFASKNQSPNQSPDDVRASLGSFFSFSSTLTNNLFLQVSQVLHVLSLLERQYKELRSALRPSTFTKANV